MATKRKATKRPPKSGVDEAVAVERFLRSNLEAQGSDFELDRAKKAYIPLLRAAYSYANGDENPAMPKGYKIVARIRRSMEEAPSGLTKQEAAAVAVDFAAMRPATEAISDPAAFGFVVRETATNSLIVAIRGTQTPGEWLKNFTAIPQPFNEVPGFGWVHLGFEQMWRSIRRDVNAALENEPKETRITFLGHSLGGAMATLGAVDIKKNLKRPAVDLATFGGPRTGKIQFRSNFNKLIPHAYRVTELRDIVPRVPSVITAWLHVGMEIEVRSKVDNPHSLDSYLEGLNNLGRTAVPAGGRESVGGRQVMAVRTA